MAEFDRTQDEAAYGDALLGDDAGREQRRARLMAALPRPEAAEVPVARTELAWRWQPYAWGAGAAALLLASVLVLKGRPAETSPPIDPRVAASPAVSAPVVVAQAEPAAPVVEAPPAVAPAARAKPRANPPPVVLADASVPQARREAEAAVAQAMESAKVAVEPPPAAPVVAAAPMAAAPLPSEDLARYDSARSRMSLAASDAAPRKMMKTADSALLTAVDRLDVATVRATLQAGASVQQRDAQGRTVLMLAARTGSSEVVDLLLAAGARNADRDGQGWTAADHARDRGHDELAERLR